MSQATLLEYRKRKRMGERGREERERERERDERERERERFYSNMHPCISAGSHAKRV